MTERLAPVAVVVVTWNSSRWIEECLTSVFGLERRPAEIVVVDNGSTDRTASRVRERFPEARLIECGANVGFCRANNLGIAETTSPFVLVLNPDTRLEPAFLESLLPAFEDRSIGMAAGKLLRFDGVTIDSAGQELARSRQPIDRGYGLRDDGRFDVDRPVFGVCGAAALYRRAMLEAVAEEGDRYFDDAFFAFYEDLDLAWRARRHGWRAAYRHRAVGYHARGGTRAEPGPIPRWTAIIRRPPEIRFHIVKNRYLAILKNDTRAAYIRNLPFIFARDLATLGLLLVTSPGVLGRLWKERSIFREALRKRKLDSGPTGHHVEGGGGA
jgi:GT2 family glycosyltransferase